MQSRACGVLLIVSTSLALVGIVGCKKSAESAAVSDDDSTGVVLDEAASTPILWSGRSYFKAPGDDVRRAEAALPNFFESLSARGPSFITKKLDTYHRQYTGFATQDGAKKIHMNFFCGAPPATWKKELVRVRGGGSCYFNLDFDLASGNFENLVINGDK
jgi:hypothetical protein